MSQTPNLKKCYACGAPDGSHLMGCPEHRQQFVKTGKTSPIVKPGPQNDSSFIIPTHHPKPITVERDPPLPDIDISTDSTAPLSDMRVGNTVLSIRQNGVQPGGMVNCHVQPMVICKLYRFWVEESCSHWFDIEDIMVGHTCCMAGIGPIHASHFSMAYRGKYPLATDWEYPINPAQRAIVRVRNLDSYSRNFAALFEVKALWGAFRGP